MKNKKSKIIVPALGLILLSTAASISGSVAWFTANRTGRVSTGQFAVVKSDGDLMATVDVGVGTEKAKSDNNNDYFDIINPITGAGSSDVSFDPVNKQLWNDDGTGSAFVKVGTNTSYSTFTNLNTTHDFVLSASEKVYYAFTWKVTLTYEWGADHTALNVFFDYSTVNGSSMTGADQNQNDQGTKNTQEGFRIAIVGARTVVYAGLHSLKANNSVGLQAITNGGNDQTTPAPVYYGADASVLDNANYSYFGSDGYAKGDTPFGSATAKASYSKATDRAANQTAREDYLGQLTFANATNGKTSIELTCVAWFEGTDPGVVDGAKMQKVNSTLAFYSCINGTNG